MSPHIIVLLAAAFGEFLEFGNSQVIAAAAIAEGAHLIIDILASVQAHDHVAHLPVAEIHDLVI